MATQTSDALETVQNYYAFIDAGNLEEAFLLFAEDTNVTFGDKPTINGRDAVADVIRNMVQPIAKSVVHAIKVSYVFDGPGENKTVIAEADVVYEMLRSGKSIAHNAVTISEVGPSGQIVEQRNVGDLRPVLEDHAANA